MKKSVGLWALVGYAVTVFGGTLLHFLYEWLEEAVWIAPFSGVNESTWEHMKLLFWPMFIFAIIQSFFFKNEKDFWCVKLKGTLIGLMLIPVLFYTYNGVIGRSPDWINIAIFFVSAGVAYIFEAWQLKKGNNNCKHPRLAFVLLCVIGIMFVVFTFKTPKIDVFIDPITGKYGIGG